jgi:hypothetical protein
MNRHLRRKAERQQFSVSMEIISNTEMARRAGEDARIAATLLRMSQAVAGPLRPRCAACENTLTLSRPPAALVVFQRLDDSTSKTLAGVCDACATAEDLAQRTASVAGVRLRSTVHPKWGHA